jgi:hypothetical protein
VGSIAGYKAGDASAVRKSMEREFDAAWSIPLDVINALDERGMIRRDIDSAVMGQLVLFQRYPANSRHANDQGALETSCDAGSGQDAARHGDRTKET